MSYYDEEDGEIRRRLSEMKAASASERYMPRVGYVGVTLKNPRQFANDLEMADLNFGDYELEVNDDKECVSIDIGTGRTMTVLRGYTVIIDHAKEIIDLVSPDDLVERYCPDWRS